MEKARQQWTIANIWETSRYSITHIIYNIHKMGLYWGVDTVYIPPLHYTHYTHHLINGKQPTLHIHTISNTKYGTKLQPAKP